MNGVSSAQLHTTLCFTSAVTILVSTSQSRVETPRVFCWQVLTPVHLGLEDVFCRWDGNLRIYDQSLHKREKAVALLGCFPRVRERLLERELEFQAGGSARSTGATFAPVRSCCCSKACCS